MRIFLLVDKGCTIGHGRHQRFCVILLMVKPLSLGQDQLTSTKTLQGPEAQNLLLLGNFLSAAGWLLKPQVYMSVISSWFLLPKLVSKPEKQEDIISLIWGSE